MTLTPEQLLAGPRGRRLCMEYAVRSAHAVRFQALASATFYASYQRSVAQGLGAVLYGNPALYDNPAEQDIPNPSAAEVADLIRQADLNEPDGTEAFEALREAVDAATYWQRPSGEDVLAAEPALRDALEWLAQLVTASPSTGWWAEPIDRTRQYAVRFEHLPHPTADPAAALAAEHAALLEEETRARRDSPSDPTAAYGGCWWSRPAVALLSTTRELGSAGPAGLTLFEDRMNWTAADVAPVTLDDAARVYEITGPDDWAHLCRIRPVDVTAARRCCWFLTTGVDRTWVLPDWRAVAEDYDAVHLTVAGYLSTAGRAIDVGAGRSSVLAGWNPDESRWLTGAAAVSGPATRWVCAEEPHWYEPRWYPESAV
ncbi:hypothetical protein [Pseudonocardia phyllosphaerae]|uniref:hypothetical protein n=1 Tax=Pseudonocardia phyllosphaerae TaxID=3390502 RepID=UPI00397B5B60